MIYCSRNDPTAVSSRPNDNSGVTSVANSGTIYLEGLMRAIPAYKYLQNGVTIQFDFISWQQDHPHLSCYVTPTWCLLIPALIRENTLCRLGMTKEWLSIMNHEDGTEQPPLCQRNFRSHTTPSACHPQDAITLPASLHRRPFPHASFVIRILLTRSGESLKFRILT